jgi:hypothetical protein
MSTYTYHEILNQVEQLMPDEQRQLLKDIEAILRRQTEPRHRHSIKASFFLTNDRELPVLPDLKVLMVDELKTRAKKATIRIEAD